MPNQQENPYNWITDSPEGRLSMSLAEGSMSLNRWRDFMKNDAALVAAQRLLIAANELLLIVDSDPVAGEEFCDRISKSCQMWIAKAQRALAGDVL